MLLRYDAEGTSDQREKTEKLHFTKLGGSCASQDTVKKAKR